MMAKDTKRAILPLSLPFLEIVWRDGILQGRSRIPLFPLVLLSGLCSVGLSSMPGLEHDWAGKPKLICTPMPVDVDPGCFAQSAVTYGPSDNGYSNGRPDGNDHESSHHIGELPGSSSGSSSRQGLSDEVKATILHLRESMVRQKETILDQQETIRELTAKLTLCESFGRGTGGYHDGDYHGPSHHGSSHSSHHYDNDHRADLYYPLKGHHSEYHRGKPQYLGKHGSSHDQAGKTLKALKERLENLQARNSSSTYSTSLRDLLQHKIGALEEQLHRHDPAHHNNQHGPGYHDDYHENHHDSHHDYRDTHHANHHNDLHYVHHYNHYYNPRFDQHSTHRSDPHDKNHDDHHDGHHNISPDRHLYSNHQDNHHDDSHHGNDDHGHQPWTTKKPIRSRAHSRGAHSKLDNVLSRLYHRLPEAGSRKKPKTPDAFQIVFPMHTNYMYGRAKHSLLNEIFALTVCLWLKGGSGLGLGTPFSYSVPGQANELVLIEWGNNPMELLVNDKAVTLPLSLTDRKWHHLCLTWSTRDGVWETYQDGVKRGSGENLSPWHTIKPGGVFILGQEQDTLGGRFDATQSFVGEMSDLQLWSRVLTAVEIHKQASCSSHFTGDIIAWSETILELHGGVTKYPFTPCH